jgi:hypothetical protein
MTAIALPTQAPIGSTLVTVSRLDQAGACPEYLELFKRLFPDGVELTVDVCVAHADDFQWEWACNRLLPHAARATWRRVYQDALTICHDFTDRVAVAYNSSFITYTTYVERTAPLTRWFNETIARAFAEVALGLPVSPVTRPATTPPNDVATTDDDDGVTGGSNAHLDRVARLVDALSKQIYVYRMAATQVRAGDPRVSHLQRARRRGAVTRVRNASNEIDRLVRAYVIESEETNRG